MLKIPFPLHRRPQVQSGLRFAAMVDLAFALKLNVDHPERFGFRDHPTPRRQSARAQEVRIMQVLYTAEATAVGGRGGHIRSSDGVLDLSLAHPSRDGRLLQRGLAIARHAQKRARETSSIARSKELFRICGLAARTTKFLRVGKGKIKNAIG